MNVFKIKKRRTGKNNHGFSLLEVLLAVVLLGLIATPILQMFYSSFALNKKSEKYLAAADLLQTVMEGISSQTWEDSKPVVSGAADVPGLKTYYAGLTGGTQKLFSGASADILATNIPEGNVTKGLNGTIATFTFTDVNYSKYKFNVEIQIDTTNDGGTGYYAFPLKVTVLDTNGHALQSAMTQIPNKR